MRTLFKIVHGTMAFSPIAAFTQRPYCGERPLEQFLREPLAKSVAFQSSFVPSSIHFWNNLPSEALKTESISAFKHSIRVLFT